jgi:TatD DNase family protein
MLVDSHCHVHFNAYNTDMDDVITRTLAEGIRLITIGTQSTTSANGLKAAEQYDGVWATVGLHPNHLCEQEFFDANELTPYDHVQPSTTGTPAPDHVKTRCERFDHEYYLSLARHPKCVAIGECGLDYYRIPEHLNRDEVIAAQKEAVRQQFELASEVGLPVVIHCRDAHADQQVIVKEFIDAGKLQRRGVVHCFTGTLEEAQAYIALGFAISFTGVITFPPRKSDARHSGLSPLQEVVRDLPLEHIMVETDAPYLTPVPHRGERNEPAYVRFVAEKVAELKRLPLEEVERVTTQNVMRVFGIKV